MANEAPVSDISPKAVQALHCEEIIEDEHHPGSQVPIPIWMALTSNTKVLVLSFFANLGALMYGFDNMAVSLCMSMPAFQEQFGELTATGYVIPAYWQSLWNALPQLACMFGAWSIGHVSDWYGRRLSFFSAGVISMAGVAVLYISTTPAIFLVGKLINAFAMGMALATGQSYVSEISPVRLRGILLSAYAFSMNVGLLISASIAFARIDVMNATAYNVVFAIGWVFPSLLILFTWIVPESPHQLVRAGQHEKARRSLERIRNKEANVTALLDEIVRTHRHEEELSSASGSKDHSFRECFRGENWRRTRIILFCNGLSQMTGATFLSNGPYFLTSAGVSATNVGMMVEIGLAFAIASSIINWCVIGSVGRRKIILTGIGIAMLFFLIMGIASCFNTSAALWTIGIALQLTWWTMGLTTGPAMAIAGEVSQARLRAESQSIGIAFNYFYSCVWNVVVPYMFNTDEGNLGGKMGWIFLATSSISFAVVYFCFPETKDRTYEEIGELFERRIPARHFADYLHIGASDESAYKLGKK